MPELRGAPKLHTRMHAQWYIFLFERNGPRGNRCARVGGHRCLHLWESWSWGLSYHRFESLSEGRLALCALRGSPTYEVSGLTEPRYLNRNASVWSPAGPRCSLLPGSSSSVFSVHVVLWRAIEKGPSGAPRNVGRRVAGWRVTRQRYVLALVHRWGDRSPFHFGRGDCWKGEEKRIKLGAEFLFYLSPPTPHPTFLPVILFN